MADVYLTHSEILEIDELNEESLVGYISGLPNEKKEIVMHLHSKNRANKLLKTVLDENVEGNKILLEIIKKHGISV